MSVAPFWSCASEPGALLNDCARFQKASSATQRAAACTHWRAAKYEAMGPSV